VVRIRGKFA